MPSAAHHHKMFIPDPFLLIRLMHRDAVSTEVEWVMQADSGALMPAYEAAYSLVSTLSLAMINYLLSKYLLILDSHQLIASFLPLKP